MVGRRCRGIVRTGTGSTVCYRDADHTGPCSSTYTEQDAIRDAQDRANRDHAPMRIYRGLSMGCDVWYVRAAEAVPPYDAPLAHVIQPQAVCPNCGQWQHTSTGDCVHECRKRGFVHD